MVLKLVLCLFLAKCGSSIEVNILEDVAVENFQDVIWTWRCSNGNCVKGAKSNGERPVGESVCKLVCAKGALWPRPTGQSQVSNSLVRLDPHSVDTPEPSTLLAGVTTEDPDISDAYTGALQVFSDLMSSKDTTCGSASGKVLQIQFEVENPEVYRYTEGANESYSLNLTAKEGKVLANIKSQNFLGARHGLETLSQLVVQDEVSGKVFAPAEAFVADSPVYTHRGIVLDTSRNFITVKSIKRTLDAMAANKMNTFHWHITDSHSFPYQSVSYPNLTKFGAYSEKKVYSQDDIRDIVRYAEARGIRIVPEIDAPAHVGEGWQWAEGAVVCFAAEPWQQYCVEPPCGQLDPTAELAYTVLEGIYSDMASLFKTDHFHMGGDEVNINCWNSTKNIVANMEKLKLTQTEEDFHEIWGRFQKRARDIVRSKFGADVKPLLWTSTLTEGARLTKYLNSSEYIIQIWTKGNDATIKHLLESGFKTILSNYDALYFDCGFGAWVGAGNNWCSPYIPWQTVYENDPKKIMKNLGVDEKYHHLMLGAESALWTEQADDASIDNRLWPRSAALGEALWSGGGRWQAAQHRLLVQRERLIQRGVQADTLQPEWCLKHEGACYL